MHGMTQYLIRHGIRLVFANVFVQQMGVPLPAEPTLVIAGSLAAKGLLSPLRVVAATVVATALADAVWFSLGRRYGHGILGVVARLSPSRAVARDGKVRFAGWGLRALLVARFLPGATQLLIPLAGARHPTPFAFLFYDLTGIVIWASVPVLGGMLLDRRAEAVIRALSASTAWLAVASLGVLGLKWWRGRRSTGRPARVLRDSTEPIQVL
jgi:membrane protein DedA with SNARE-associated domain